MGNEYSRESEKINIRNPGHEDHDISEDFPRNFLMPGHHKCADESQKMSRLDKMLSEESDRILSAVISSPSQRARLSKYTTEVSPISIEFSGVPTGLNEKSLGSPVEHKHTATQSSPMFIEFEVTGRKQLERIPVSPITTSHTNKCVGLAEMMMKNANNNTQVEKQKGGDNDIRTSEMHRILASDAGLTHLNGGFNKITSSDMRKVLGVGSASMKETLNNVNHNGGSISTNEFENIFGGMSSAKDDSSSSSSSTSSPYHIDDDSSSEKKKHKESSSSSSSSTSSSSSVSSIDERGVDISSFHTPNHGKLVSEGNDSFDTEEVNAALEILQKNKSNKSTKSTKGVLSENENTLKYNKKSQYFGGN